MKLGDLMFLKSSEEPTVILALNDVLDHPESKVTVRRPLITSEGTKYESAEFFRFELETPEEQDIRKIEDIKRRHRLTQAAQKDTPLQLEFDMTGPVDPNAPRN